MKTLMGISKNPFFMSSSPGKAEINLHPSFKEKGKW